MTSNSVCIPYPGSSSPHSAIVAPLGYRYSWSSVQNRTPLGSGNTFFSNVTTAACVRLFRTFRTIAPRIGRWYAMKLSFSSAALDFPVPAGPASSTSRPRYRINSAHAPYGSHPPTRLRTPHPRLPLPPPPIFPLRRNYHQPTGPEIIFFLPSAAQERGGVP